VGHELSAGARDGPSLDSALPGEELDVRRALWESASQIIVDSSWSARTFQKAASRWATVAVYVGLPSSIAATVAAAGAGATALLTRVPVLAGVLGLAAAVLAGTRAVLRPEETYQGYASKGAAYLVLRNDTREFRGLRIGSSRWTSAELESELRALNARLNALAQQPPLRAPTWAYRQAQKSVEAGESDYVADHFWQAVPF